VLGYRPMRLLCLLMGLEPPDVPAGDHVVATREDLLERSVADDEPPLRCKRGQDGDWASPIAWGSSFGARAFGEEIPPDTP